LLVAPKLGLFEPISRASGAFYAGVEVGYVTPLFDHGLAFVLELDWYRPKLSGTVTDPRLTVNGTTANGAYRSGQAEIGLMLSAVYRAEDKPIEGLTPYGGLGPGLFWHRAAMTAFGTTNIETSTTVGLQLLAGADYRVGPGALFAETRYHFAKVSFISTGNANVGGFLALSLGYRLRFF
jgi:opacity protein-like surface antigen